MIVQEDGKDLIQRDLADWGSRIAKEVCSAVSRVIAEYSVSVAAKALELAGAEAMADAVHQVKILDDDGGKLPKRIQRRCVAVAERNDRVQEGQQCS